MTKVEQLVKFVSDEFGIHLRAESFRRVRPGYWQRSRGAWSWGILEENGYDFGSQSSVTDLLKYKDYVHLFEDGSNRELIIENHKRFNLGTKQ